MIKGNVCGHYVAIRPDEVEKVSAGGIVLATDYNQNEKNRTEAGSTRGVVVDVGRTAWHAYDKQSTDWKPWAAVGDTVWFQRHAAKVIEDESELDKDGKPQKIFIMADENVLFNEGKADE